MFETAGGIYARYNVPYDELRPHEVAEAARRDMGQLFPGVAGGLCVGHPAACLALSEAAEAAGVKVLRGVSNVQVTSGAIRMCASSMATPSTNWSARW